MGFEFFKKRPKKAPSPGNTDKPWEQVEKSLREHLSNPKELPTAELDALKIVEVDKINPEEADEIVDKLSEYYAPFWKPADWHLLSRSKEIPKPHNFEEALVLLRRLKPKAQRLFMRYVDNELLFEKFVAKKKDADKQNPKRTFARLDEYSKEFYRKKGININSPTVEDIAKYQARVEYTLPLVSHELERRTERDFPNYSDQERSDMNRLLWDINDLWSEFDENGRLTKRLRGELWVQKLQELKMRLAER